MFAFVPETTPPSEAGVRALWRGGTVLVHTSDCCVHTHLTHIESTLAIIFSIFIFSYFVLCSGRNIKKQDIIKTFRIKKHDILILNMFVLFFWDSCFLSPLYSQDWNQKLLETLNLLMSLQSHCCCRYSQLFLFLMELFYLNTFDLTLCKVNYESGKSRQLGSQWKMNVTTVFQFKFMKSNFMSALVKYHLDLRRFDSSVISLNHPKSLKTGECLPSTTFQLVSR